MPVIPDTTRKNFVYAVRLTHDPTHEYRYVGQTSQGVRRLQQHLLKAKRKSCSEYNTRKYTWMRSHYLQVTFDIIEFVDDPALLNISEMKWIHIFSQRGYNLVNHTLGGDGTRGFTFKHTDEAKQLIAASRRGVPKSDETRARMSEAQKGLPRKPHSAEVQRKISEKNRGQKRTEETKAKISSALKGNTHSLGARHSKEVKEKISISKTGHLNPMYGKVPSADTIEKRRVTYHINNHIAKNKIGPTCLLCLGG